MPDAMTLLYTTWPSEEPARSAATVLLNEHLIACANMLGPSRSIYRWEGAVQEDSEIVVLFKTAAGKAQTVRDRLVGLHPYDEPCVIALDVDSAASARGFLAWVQSETGIRD